MADQTPLDLDAFRSRIKELTEIQRSYHETAHLIAADEDELIKECVLQLEGRISEIIEEYSDVGCLKDEDFDAYLEHLKGELSHVEAENAKLSNEVGNLSMGFLEDSIRLQTNIEGLNCSLEFIESQGLEAKRTDALLECSSDAEHQKVSVSAHGDCKFKILELNSQIEKKKGSLKALEDLDFSLKRFDDILKIEDVFTGLEVIEYEGNRIRLSLQTYIHETDKSEQYHELTIELLNGTLELKDAEIFPDDVYIGEIVDAARSFRQQFSLFSMFERKASLEWFVRRVQDRIVLSTMRKFLVKAASKSRHVVEYVERDEMIVAHMVGGFDAFIKISQGWPMANSALKLLSLKGSNQSSKEVTLSFLCKVEETVNSLDAHVCQNVSTFIDAIEEILKQKMHVELKSNSSIDK